MNRGRGQRSYCRRGPVAEPQQMMSGLGIDPGPRVPHGKRENQLLYRCGGWDTRGLLKGPAPPFKAEIPKG